MDFWDVVKLMWRRWYVTAPMLLLTATAALVTGLNVSADYQVTDHFAMVRSSAPEDPEETARLVNPWSSEALAEAASIRLGGRALEEEMAAAGYEGSWSLDVTGSQPWLRLEVVAKSPEQAQATGARLREIIEAEVRLRQEEHNIPPEEQITTVRFDEGETVETITRALRQALVAVAAAGVLATIGTVLVFDVIARRRKPAATAAAEPTAPQPRYTYVARNPANSGDHATGVTQSTAPNGATRAEREPAQPVAGRQSEAVVTPAASPLSTDQVADDATIVLPRTGQPWAGWPPDRQDSNGEWELHR